MASSLSLVSPDGQRFCAERDGDLFAFWLEGQPERWEASDRRFAAGALASALGFNVGHEELPDWIGELAGTVIAALDGGG